MRHPWLAEADQLSWYAYVLLSMPMATRFGTRSSILALVCKLTLNTASRRALWTSIFSQWQASSAMSWNMSRSSPIWPSLPGVILYAVAVLAVAAAVVAGLVVERFLQTAPFVSLFLCAILFAAWLGGAGPGLLATGLSVLAFEYYFIPPADSFAVQDVPRIALFAMTALFVVWVSAAQRRTAEYLQRARDDLRATVQELENLNKSLQTENAERTRAEQSIRQAERELQVTIDSIPALAARYRRDGSLDFVNQTWRTYTGLSQESLRGQRWGVAIHPDDLPLVEAAWRAHLPTGEPFQMEQRLRRADGEYRWHFVRRVPHRNENGEVIRWYGVGHDIEDQKRAESALNLVDTMRKKNSENSKANRIETMKGPAESGQICSVGRTKVAK
jgi:PAS domain S-box-containing protein